MFKEFLDEILQSKNNGPTYITIGEDHRHSSALIGLANELKTIQASGRQVVVITEDLKKRESALNRDSPYSARELAKVMPGHDKDFQPLQAIVKAGVMVYGVESKHTAPGLSLKGNTKEKLFIDAQKKIPELFTKQDGTPNHEMIARIEQAKNDDEAYDVDGFRDCLNARYGELDARVRRVNEQVTDQMRTAGNKFRNPVVIFTGGAAHIPVARDINDSSNIKEPGINARLADFAGLNNVHTCFVSSNPANSPEGYTVNPDHSFRYDPIKNQFQVEDKFSGIQPAKQKRDARLPSVFSDTMQKIREKRESAQNKKSEARSGKSHDGSHSLQSESQDSDPELTTPKPNSMRS